MANPRIPDNWRSFDKKGTDRWADTFLGQAEIEDNISQGQKDQTDDDDGYQIDPDPALKPVKMTAMEHTSTTNPSRPRTLAAGYDPRKQILTVVFRDGTWWNYYDVPQDLWDGFRAAESKGQYLRESGLDSWDSMGLADVGKISQRRRTLINKMAKLQASQYGD